jgi:hypothetical protein
MASSMVGLWGGLVGIDLAFADLVAKGAGHHPGRHNQLLGKPLDVRVRVDGGGGEFGSVSH